MFNSKKKTTTFHFGDHEVTLKSNSKLDVYWTRDENKKIITYDIVESDYNIFLCRVQCSVKYIIVFFAESNSGYLYNKKTGEKEFFEAISWNMDEEVIDNGFSLDTSRIFTELKIDKYVYKDKVWEFKYDDEGNLVEINSTEATATPTYVVGYHEDNISEKDIPIVCIDNIFMHQKGAIIYEATTA